MAVTVQIISGSSGAGFETVLQAAIESGSAPVGNPWGDSTTTYQEILVYSVTDVNVNPDLLSRPFRAAQGIINTYPTSSELSVSESQYYYQ